MNTLILFLKAVIIFLLLSSSYSQGQHFVKVTDPSNPIVTAIVSSGTYTGASWIDYNGDGRLDLFWNQNSNIYTGNPGNIFTTNTNQITQQGSSFGNTWADIDNDGDMDCFISGGSNRGSFLYINNGGSFTKVTSGLIADSTNNEGWGCSWGDYDNDGYVDLIIAAAFGFSSISNTNRLFHNNGDGTFTRIDTTQITATNGPYTVPTWNDYDLDGDIDLFIGSGPANNVGARDYLYHNYLKETGTAYFERLDTGSIGTDIVDGQVWNWIDYDNDGDLDGFLTNYSNNINNKFYKNEGNYYFRSLSSAEVGSIVSDPGLYLANIWQDFDNDGDLDCILTRDSGPSRYYNNNGDGTLTRIDTLQITTGTTANYGATAGDYDKDGDMDVYLHGFTPSRGLFRNDLNNGNNWISITCKGIGGANGSNLSAIGTTVKVKSSINGTPTWQIRSVLSQNSFNCQNDLSAHFGLGNSSTIDSLVIVWPSGIVDFYTNVNINSFYNATEGQSIDPLGIETLSNEIPEKFLLHQNYPNPFNPETNIRFDIKESGFITLKVYDMIGREVAVLVNEVQQPGSKLVRWNGADQTSGIYFYRLESGKNIESKKMILVK